MKYNANSDTRYDEVEEVKYVLGPDAYELRHPLWHVSWHARVPAWQQTRRSSVIVTRRRFLAHFGFSITTPSSVPKLDNSPSENP